MGEAAELEHDREEAAANWLSDERGSVTCPVTNTACRYASCSFTSCGREAGFEEHEL